MPRKPLVVQLTEADYKFMRGLQRTRKLSHQAKKRIAIGLGLYANPDISVKELAAQVGVSAHVIAGFKHKYTHRGIEQTILRSRVRARRKGEQEVLALLRTNPPDGVEMWSLRALAHAVHEHCGIRMSRETVRLILHDHNMSKNKYPCTGNLRGWK